MKFLFLGGQCNYSSDEENFGTNVVSVSGISSGRCGLLKDKKKKSEVRLLVGEEELLKYTETVPCNSIKFSLPRI